MKNVMGGIVRRYYPEAFRQATKASGRLDAEVIAAVGGRSGDACKTLSDWIRLYKIHRVKWRPGAEDDWPLEVGGVADEKTTFAEAVAETALGIFEKPAAGMAPDTIDAFGRLREAIGELYLRRTGHERQFLSLTSKVLWCFYPASTPIYDQFAYRSVVFLSKVYKALYLEAAYTGDDDPGNWGAEFPGCWEDAAQAEQDSWWYGEFYRAHRALFEICRSDIEALLSATPDTPAHVDALRIFDKILWMFGNEVLDYSLVNLENPEKRL